MGRIRGFLLKHRVKTVLRRVFRRSFSRRRLNPPENIRVKLIKWTQRLKTKAKAIVASNMHPGRGYIRVGQEPFIKKSVPVPKGHMAVYVGHKDGDVERILVPVAYFNHPLFGELLSEAENEYGFDQPGGIMLPCRVAEFERVKTRIKAGRFTRKLMKWKDPNTSWGI